MIRSFCLTASITASCLIFGGSAVMAQTAPTNDVPKYEVAGDFSSVSLESGTNLSGLGGRFTYNLNRHIALEAHRGEFALMREDRADVHNIRLERIEHFPGVIKCPGVI